MSSYDIQIINDGTNECMYDKYWRFSTYCAPHSGVWHFQLVFVFNIEALIAIVIIIVAVLFVFCSVNKYSSGTPVGEMGWW